MARRGKLTKRATARTKAGSDVKRTRSQRPIVVYIHGIGNQAAPDELKRQWDLAAFGQEMGDATRMAYWADLVGNDPASRKKKGVRAPDNKVPLEASALLAAAGLDPKDKRAINLVEALATSLATPVGAAPPRRGARTKALPLPGFLRRPIAERFLRWFVKDTASYFFDPEIRRQIKSRLIAEIPTGGEPFVLLAHSQGTIAAYEVLTGLQSRTEARQFVTLGSPLGIQEVQDLLPRPLEVPPKVAGWSNFADRLDPVALDPTLSREFEPRGSVRIVDRLVINERTRELLRFNPHSSIGYVSHPAVRSTVHHALGWDSSSRFVVARDVVERFVGAGIRQPVLIEVLHPGYWATGEDSQEMRRREKAQPKGMAELQGRITNLADQITKELEANARKEGKSPKAAVAVAREARVHRLRKYVAAHLTPEELEWLAHGHAELNVYAVWRSSEKRKLITRSTSPIKVDAARASYASEGRGITWAVLDTGVRMDHPHFKTNGTVLEVLDCTTDSDEPVRITDSKKTDPDGHGTHVAGIIAGEAKDPKRGLVRAIAPLAKLLAYKVLDHEGVGEDAWIIKAIDDIYRRNDAGMGLQVHGVNLSLGGPFDASVYGCGYSPICKELRDLWRQGVLVCVAAGNEGQIQVLTGEGELDLNTQVSVGDPANLDDCIAVGSVNADKPHLYGVSWFSSRGPTADGRAKPDVVAPGERILSSNSDFRGTTPSKYRDLYRHDSGTSMACPHVSGLLAAFLSVRREFKGRSDEVKKILMDNCNDIGRERYHQGAGLPNLMKMLLNT